MLTQVNSLESNELRQALEKYRAGKIGGKPLRPKSLKDRQVECDALKRYFESTTWEFSFETALEYKERRETTLTQYKKLPTPATIATYVAKLRAFNQWLVDLDYLTKNFCKKIPKPTEDETMPVIKMYDLKTIERAIILGTTPLKGENGKGVPKKAESRVTLLFMLRSPRRVNEIWMLRGKDIHENGTYTATMKGGKRMNFPIPASQYDMMMSRRHKKWVFEIGSATLTKHLRDGLRLMGEPEEVVKETRAHHIRAFAAVDKLNRGWSLKKVSQFLGHKKQSTTERYYLPYVSSHLKEITDDNPLDPDELPITRQIDSARITLEKMFYGSRFEQPRLIMLGDKILYEIPLTAAGIEEMKKPKDKMYIKGDSEF